MTTHILLFGSTGMLGRYIYSYFKHHPTLRLDVVTNDEFRVTEDTLDGIDALLDRHSVDAATCVINCIGRIPQRAGRDTERGYYLVNSLFPHLLGASCKRRGARMIQPTTDCVFSGTKGLYTETDLHDEKGAYGLSKSLGEPLGCTVLRTSILGNELFNKKSMLEWVLSNNDKTINGWTNHHWNGITCLEYCKVVETILNRNLFWSGIRHIASPTPKSKYELAVLIRDIYQRSIVINPVETETAVDKTLATLYPTNDEFNIPDLSVQIEELKRFSLLE